MLRKCYWIVLYIVHVTAFCLGGGAFFSGHGVHTIKVNNATHFSHFNIIYYNYNYHYHIGMKPVGFSPTNIVINRDRLNNVSCVDKKNQKKMHVLTR